VMCDRVSFSSLLSHAGFRPDCCSLIMTHDGEHGPVSLWHETLLHHSHFRHEPDMTPPEASGPRGPHRHPRSSTCVTYLRYFDKPEQARATPPERRSPKQSYIIVYDGLTRFVELCMCARCFTVALAFITTRPCPAFV
jgi:hypothetical protein